MHKSYVMIVNIGEVRPDVVRARFGLKAPAEGVIWLGEERSVPVGEAYPVHFDIEVTVPEYPEDPDELDERTGELDTQDDGEPS